MAASRNTNDKAGVVIHKIIPVVGGTNGGTKPPVRAKSISEPPRDLISEPPKRENQTGMLAVRTFDLGSFLDGMAMAKPSTRDDSVIVVSSGKFYNVFTRGKEDEPKFGPGMDMNRMAKLDGPGQVYYIFQRTGK
jgi:hypothetical protein